MTLLATCHRVELYLVVRSEEVVERWFELLPADRRSWKVQGGREAVRHLFRVAAGVESMAAGEIEIRHQVRSAGRGVRGASPRPLLHELFDRAARAAEAAAPSGERCRSVASIAAERLIERFAPARPHVVIVGTGTAGRRTVEALGRAAELSLVYHDRLPEPTLREAVEGRVVRLDQLAEVLDRADALVCASRTGSYCVGEDDLPGDRPLVLVDMGVPRNIDPAVRGHPGIELWDLEDLWRTGRGAEVPWDLRALNDLADEAARRVEALLREPWIAALRHRAERVRASELAVARRHLGPLTPAQEVAVERLTQRLVARLLLGPTERLRELPADAEADRLRRFALDLLRPDRGES